MVVLPLSCFPDRLWFARYCASDRPVIDIGEHYVKQSYRNRFKLMGSHGSFVCTVRVKGQKGQKTPMHSIELVEDEWRRVAFRGLRSAYARAAYWEHFADTLEAIFMADQVRLVDFNLSALVFLLDAMGIHARHELATEYIPASHTSIDFRMDAEPGREETGFLNYPQVFEDRHGFVGGLSALDLVLNMGPESVHYLA